jgi:uncharacterized protein (DUF58 family)
MSLWRYKYFHPRQAAQLQPLEVTVRGIVEGAYAGLHKSPHKGFSVEFAEHREYTPGDELKHLDWNVLARTDRYYVKQFEQETNLRAMICLDCSGSMAFGNAQLPGPDGSLRQGVTKFDYASIMAASMSYLLAMQQDMVGLTAFDTQVRYMLPYGHGAGHLDQIFKHLERTQPASQTDTAAALEQVAARIPRRGLVVLLSDLLDEPERIVHTLQRLRHGHHHVIVMQVLDRGELTLNHDRPVTFKDMEDQSQLTLDPKPLKAAYAQAMQDFLHLIHQRCGQMRITHHVLETSVPWAQQLRKVLHLATRH